jgi:AcrR family transcriptional regulator
MSTALDFDTVRFIGTDDDSVKARLIRAADVEVAEYGVNALQMEAVAKRAGVSRATAFRQMGSISEVLVQVALMRVQTHITRMLMLMDSKPTVFSKLEAAVVYATREFPVDPAIAALIARHSAFVNDRRVHQHAIDLVGAVLREGQSRGEVRTDLALGELVDFLTEQTYLAAEAMDRSEDVVRKRFRHFVIPALEARSCCGGEHLSRVTEVEHAVAAAREALENLTQKLSAANQSN